MDRPKDVFRYRATAQGIVGEDLLSRLEEAGLVVIGRDDFKLLVNGFDALMAKESASTRSDP